MVGERYELVFKPDLYIVARIIERILQSKETRLKRTQLQMKTGLNWNVFSRYLDLLLANGLLAMEYEPGGEYVIVTEKGRRAYRALLDSIAQILGMTWMQERLHRISSERL